MLIKYSVENFLSFKNRQSVSLYSNKGKRLENHIVEDNGRRRLLKGQVCFGANGSGKTNLVKSFDFAKRMVLKGIPREATEKKVFRGHSNEVKPNSFFGFHFEYDSKEILYEIEVNMIERYVQREEAFLMPSKKRIFSRIRKDEGGYVFKKDDNIKKKKSDIERYLIYIEDFNRENNYQVNSRQFFAIDVSKKAPVNSNFFGLFHSIHGFFDSVIAIYTNSYYTQIMRHVESEDEKKELITLLQGLDVNISDLKNERIDPDIYIKDMDDELKQKLYDKLDKSNGTYCCKTTNGNLITIKKDESNNLIAEKLQIMHDDSLPFDSNEESEGILRLFDFAPLLLSGDSNDELILIDEIDRSLHTLVTKKLIDKIFNSKDKRVQFIITSHDADLIDFNLLRQDEIVLIDKESTETELNSLRDKKIRFDKKILNEYIQGKIGGVPHIK